MPQILLKQPTSTEVAARTRARGSPQITEAQEPEIAHKQEFVAESRCRSSKLQKCQRSYKRRGSCSPAEHEGRKSLHCPLRAVLIRFQTVTAYCAAEQYDLAAVANILKNAAYHLDPYGTGLYPGVVHVEVPNQTPSRRTVGGSITTGDVFIFPSGTVVAWDVPESTISFLVSRTLASAAVHPHPDQLEEEDLEYLEDPTRESSAIKGDTIILGTKAISDPLSSSSSSLSSTSLDQTTPNNQTRTIDTVLTKIAFSSGLARSTKLAVLETLFSTYLSTTLSIPRLLSHGSRLPYTRTTILQKTGQLLSLRAQLNLYSELTDSLPDLFWDSKYELGLEGYYDMVGRALDVGVRIKVLNGKLDYATEIAEVLRGQLSERHGVRLEWIIITLITVEVGFAVRQEVKEYRERKENEMEKAVLA
ncbi:MAG: hypothetical protein Q9205_001224 [Flavoplaca limonia]